MDDTGRIYRNGVLVPEQGVIYGAAGGGEMMTFTVPEGSYFYLGDNRPVSNDSRQDGMYLKKTALRKGIPDFSALKRDSRNK